MKELSISVRHYIKVSEIENLLDSASRGSAYWCENDLGYQSSVDKVMNGKGITVTNLEAMGGEQIEYEFNLSSVKRGLRILAKEHNSHFADFVGGEGDMITGDVFLQCCLFGEVVYS